MSRTTPGIRRSRLGRIAGPTAVLSILALSGVVGLILGAEPDSGGTPASAEDDSIPSLHPLAKDPRVLAIMESYGPLIDSVSLVDGDAVFMFPRGPIYFRDGRMLSETHLGDSSRYSSIFYAYPLRPLIEPPPLQEEPVHSTDLLEALFGTTEGQIRTHGESMEFLGRKVFVNRFCADELRKVDREIQDAARADPEVAAWVGDIAVAYSFIDKEIVGSGSRSRHSWGLALDLVPSSYRGKQAYWRWSRVFNRAGWHLIPMADRWSPPRAVIETFERNGFVWGGKWARFDTIHFEFRPEILAYNRAMESHAEAIPAGANPSNR